MVKFGDWNDISKHSQENYEEDLIWEQTGDLEMEIRRQVKFCNTQKHNHDRELTDRSTWKEWHWELGYPIERNNYVRGFWGKRWANKDKFGVIPELGVEWGNCSVTEARGRRKF